MSPILTVTCCWRDLAITLTATAKLKKKSLDKGNCIRQRWPAWQALRKHISKNIKLIFLHFNSRNQEKKSLIPRLIILKGNRDYIKETNTHNKNRTTSHVIQYKKLIADFNLELEYLSWSSWKWHFIHIPFKCGSFEGMSKKWLFSIADCLTPQYVVHMLP